MVKADDFGSYHANPKIIRSNCLPLRVDETTVEQVESWLRELESAGLIERYTGPDERSYLHFVKWEKHQQIRSKKPKFPQISEGVRFGDMISDDIKCNQMISDDSRRNQMTANVPVIQSNTIQSKNQSNTKSGKGYTSFNDNPDDPINQFRRWDDEQ